MKLNSCLLIFIVAMLLGCGRTYHVYNIVEGGTLNQTIEVAAEVPKTVNTNTDVAPNLGALP